ncbi:AEC family transporter [Paenibacillus pasadenensis]|uniref:AEC family transporter n=1 Tax=Paenibacillus pasadenensis TaxID=217090 RepID=UPI00203C7D5D|nr:AEC family transporter [Paenibacillus pasadenensis]MCM3748236.1 AEC family transporter [Paenibacillus pasadenensis]
MALLGSILLNNIIPLCIMIIIGVVLQRIFELDIRTLSKLNFYLFSPAVIFKLLYTTDIPVALIGQVLLFFGVFMALQYALLELVVRLRGYEGGMRAAMRNSVLFYNSANYGIPLNQLAFAANPFTLSIQVLVMMMQSLLPNTYGIYSVNAHKTSIAGIRRQIVSQPVIYVIPLAFALNWAAMPIPVYLSTPLDYVANAFIGTALLTLGVQLGSMKREGGLGGKRQLDLVLSLSLRLIAGPALAALTVWMLGIDGLAAKALIVSSAVPTSLSSVLLAVEFDNEPEFSSQTVLLSTVLSIVTVTAVIALLGI